MCALATSAMQIHDSLSFILKITALSFILYLSCTMIRIMRRFNGKARILRLSLGAVVDFFYGSNT